jgi:hypothetical protein
LRDQHLTALAAKDYISGTVDRRAAAQDGTFMQTASITDHCPRFANVPVFLNIAAHATQRNLKLGLVVVRDAHRLLAAAGKCEQQCRQSC